MFPSQRDREPHIASPSVLRVGVVVTSMVWIEPALEYDESPGYHDWVGCAEDSPPCQRKIVVKNIDLESLVYHR